MKLSVITLTLNNIEYTKKYIKSLYENTKDFELIIVDNGSTDGTVEYLKSLKYGNLKLILNKENLGFSKGNNQGIEIAKGDYIGFLNNDILLPPNWFDEVLSVFEKEPKAAFVSPFHLNTTYYKLNDKNYLKYFENMNKKKKKRINYRKSYHECVFSCVVTPNKILKEIGGFDEIYTPALCEDDDIKCRAINFGYDVYVTYRTCFFHYYSSTVKYFSTAADKNKRIFYSNHRDGEYIHAMIEEYWDLLTYRKSIFFDMYNFSQRIRRFINNQIIRRVKRLTIGYPISFAWSNEFLNYFNTNDMPEKLDNLKSDLDEISKEYVDYFMALSKYWFGGCTKKLWTRYDKKLFKENKKFLKTFKQPFPKIAEFNPFIFSNNYGLNDLPKALIDTLNGKTVIDIGGFNGDTAYMFHKFLPKSKIFVYEPLSIHINKLKKMLEIDNCENKVIPIQKGIGNKKEQTEISFVETELCQITTIDKEFENTTEDIGLIKMDVEGFESKVVEGATETIKKFKPVLAIAIYHTPEDFFEMKDKIKALNPDYKFMIRRSEAVVPQTDLVLIAY